MLADALEHLVRGIVDRPEDVKVRLRTQRHRETLEVRVHPDDLYELSAGLVVPPRASVW